jgi:hypothetical protein
METSSRRGAGSRHAFVGFIDGSPESARSVESLKPDSSEETSDVNSSEGSLSDAGSIRPVGSYKLGPGSAEYNPDFPQFEPPYCATVFMADSEEQGGQGAQNTTQSRPVVSTAPNSDRQEPEVLLGAEALTEALNSLDEALATPMTAENQEAWRTKVNGLKAQVMSIRREINSRNAQMVEKESRLAQEARRL